MGENQNYDFAGWATRFNVKCADGRTIRHGAFDDCDGVKVPLVWNHKHGEAGNVLGHALLQVKDEGVWMLGSFNNTANGQDAKEQVCHGDITCLSIFANHLRERAGDVYHGMIREVSLVLAGANPEARIETVLCHGDNADGEYEEDSIIFMGDSAIELFHAEIEEDEKEDTNVDNYANDPELEHKDSDGEKDGEETVQDVIDTMNEKQQNAMYALAGLAYEKGKKEAQGGEDNDDSEGGEKEMKHNLFDAEYEETGAILTHADQMEIVAMAKNSNIGTLQNAIAAFADKTGDEALAHGFEDITEFFPEYKDLKPGAPEMITRDQGWISVVINGVHKSPISRIRTRQLDVRNAALRGRGYKKGNKKEELGNAALLKRTTDPQTIYVKDKLDRDDIIDITDFNVVDYEYQVMKMMLNEEVATAVLFGDGREIGDDDKISEDHIRPVWLDDELYTIHATIDLAKAKTELQGSDTGVHFGENYIYAEAMVNTVLYAREQYKGSGNMIAYMTPHVLNTMLLARDYNGRRIYASKQELCSVLDVKDIQTVEQMEGLTRTVGEETKALLALFVNLDDYHMGSTKGGEITTFNQFDIDFNQEKYLMETRLSGALTRIKSAIAIEQNVVLAAG